MDKETQLWNQYTLLREEIKQADELNYQILGVVVGATAVILTTGFSQNDPFVRIFIFLCVYVVTIPAYRLTIGNRRRTWRISTYMRTFLESQLEHVKWETRLEMQNKAHQRGWSPSSLISINEWFIFSMLNGVATLASIFVGLLQINASFLIRSIGLVVLIGSNAYFLIRASNQEKSLRRGGKVEMSSYQSWIEVRETEELMVNLGISQAASGLKMNTTSSPDTTRQV